MPVSGQLEKDFTPLLKILIKAGTKHPIYTLPVNPPIFKINKPYAFN